MAKGTIDTATSVLTQRELDAFCKKWNIPASVEPELPGPMILLGIVWRKWNDHFFWVKSSVVPISVPWFEGSSVEKDPPPSDHIVDFGLMELLNENRSGFRKYHEVFLCVVGLSRAYDDEDVHPTFLDSDNKEMGLFDFIKSSDSFKVKVGETTLADGEVSLLKETEDRPPVKKSKTAPSAGPPLQKKKNPSTGGKTPAALQKLVSLGTLPEKIESGSASAAMDAFVSESVTPSYWVKSAMAMISSPVHEAETSSAAPGEASPVGDFYESQTIDSAKAKDVYITTWDITNDFKLNDAVVYRNFIHHILPPEGGGRPRKGYGVEIGDLVWKAGSDAQSCLGSVVVSQLEAATTARVEELVGLGAKNTELIGQVSGLKTLRDELKSHIKGEEEMGREFLVVQDAQAKRMEEQTTELDERLAALNTNVNGLRLAVMKFKESYECQSRLGKAISLAIKKGIQDGLKVRIEHGKAGRGLENNESYDAEVEAKYLVAVKDLEYVPFPLLEDLEARKDSIIELLMASLTLGGSRVPGSMVHEILLHDALAASRARGEMKKKKDASLDLARTVEALIVTSVVVTVGAVPVSSSAPETEVIVQESSIAVTDYQISDLNIAGDVTQNGNDMFDSSVLDIPKDNQASAPE
ncbi:hypothetical protein Tco_0633873 [Tanacetum coccineum]